jgi:4-amino-4-deoxy-L-arabinose transferase-like glycosyltransferase
VQINADSPKQAIAQPARKRRWLVPSGVIILLLALFLQLAFSTRRNSITWDEDDHIYAGYMSWKHADFGLNPEHPPLVKLLGTLPLLHMSLTMPQPQDRFFKTEAFLNGKDFLFKNDADKMLFRVHLAVASLTLLLALIVFLAAQEMFGTAAGFIALGLVVFDPNLLAHGAVLGTDVGLSCFMFGSIYAFYRYVKAPSAWRMALVGMFAGLALAAKHTAILICPMLIMLSVVEIVRNSSPSDESRKKYAFRLAGAIVVISVIAIAILWGFYGFRYQARPAGMQLNPPLAEFMHGLSRPHEVKGLQFVANWKLLPESYIYGLTDVRIMSDFYQSYLFGTVYPHGVWSYFPATFVIKSTLTLLILLVVAIVAIATRKLTCWREILFLTIPPAFYLLIAMASRMNIGLRHILPMYAFLWVLAAGGAVALIRTNRKWAYAVVALLVFQAVSSARAYPAYMAYANELWGGPSQTYKYLSDSNADWGQQLKSVKKYLDARGVKECWFVYFGEGVIDTKYYGIPCKPLPTADSLWVNEKIEAPPAIDGPVLISAGDLSGFEYGPGALNPYAQFQTLKPTAVIDYSVFVFDGHFEIPLAAAKSHIQTARGLMEAKQFDSALLEAQQAVALAPDNAEANAVLGDVLTELHRWEEARAAYEKALHLAQTVEPEFQVGSIDGLQQKLAKLRMPAAGSSGIN